MSEDGYRFTLSGRKALAALAVVFGWYGLNVWYHIRPVDDAGRNAIHAWLLRGHRGDAAEDVLRQLQAVKAGLPLEPETETPPMDAQIVSASAHGGTAHMIVKVEVTVNGGPPPDGRSTRYFYVSRDFDDTWHVLWESNSYFYKRALWSIP